MNKLKFVMAAGLLAATAACTQTGYDNSYAYNSGYNTRPAYNNVPNNAPRPPYGGNYAYNNGGYNNGGYNNNANYARPPNPRGPNGDYDSPERLPERSGSRFRVRSLLDHGSPSLRRRCVPGPPPSLATLLAWERPLRNWAFLLEGQNALRQLARRREPCDGDGGVR